MRLYSNFYTLLLTEFRQMFGWTDLLVVGNGAGEIPQHQIETGSVPRAVVTELHTAL